MMTLTSHCEDLVELYTKKIRDQSIAKGKQAEERNYQKHHPASQCLQFAKAG
jgi:hypothetical protein